MARKEDKQPQHLPLVVKARLHTGSRDYEKIKEELKGQGFTCKQMKGMVREGNYFDGIVLYLSKWNWDNHESWHLYNWDDKDDKEVMLGILKSCKEDFEKNGTLEEQHKRGMKRLEELKTADPVKTFCKNTGATMQLEYKEDGNMTLWYLRFFYKEN